MCTGYTTLLQRNVRVLRRHCTPTPLRNETMRSFRNRKYSWHGPLVARTKGVTGVSPATFSPGALVESIPEGEIIVVASFRLAGELAARVLCCPPKEAYYTLKHDHVKLSGVPVSSSDTSRSGHCRVRDEAEPAPDPASREQRRRETAGTARSCGRTTRAISRR